MKLKKGVNPVGTSFNIASMGDGGKITWHTYNVVRVTGASKHIPGIDTTLHLEYDFTKRSGNACAPFLSIHFDDFADRVEMGNPRIIPVSETDIFWESIKSDVALIEDEI